MAEFFALLSLGCVAIGNLQKTFESGLDFIFVVICKSYFLLVQDFLLYCLSVCSVFLCLVISFISAFQFMFDVLGPLAAYFSQILQILVSSLVVFLVLWIQSNKDLLLSVLLWDILLHTLLGNGVLFAPLLKEFLAHFFAVTSFVSKAAIRS